MKKQGLWKWFLILFLVLLVTGCSGDSDSDEIAAGAESIYSPGASVGAVGYNDAYGIEVFVLDGQGNFMPVCDGDYAEPGVKTFGVQLEGDPSNIDRVFFSDGGFYQIEAFKQGDLYVGEFDASEENLYQNILVQVIHNNSLASKEKVVLRTFQHDYGNQYIKNGVGLLVAREILDGQRDALAEYLDEILGDVFLHLSTQADGLFDELGYGDNDPGTVNIEISSIESTHIDEYPQAVIHVSLVVEDVRISALSLYGQSLVSTNNNDLAIDLYLAADDEGEDGSTLFILDFLDSVQMSFEKEFFLKSIVEEMLISEFTKVELPPLARDLSGLDHDFAGLSENLLVYGKEVDSDILSDGLVMDLDKYLFADIYGIPESTNPDELALGIGLYTEDYEDIIWESYESGPTSSDPFDMEDEFDDVFETVVDDAFEGIRQEYDGLVTELSYGDDDPDTRDFTINSFVVEDTADNNIKNVIINYTIKDVDFSAVSFLGFALIQTQDNDLTVDSVMTMEHRFSGSEDVLVLDITDVSSVDFSQWFLGREVVEDTIKTDLSEMEETSISVKDIMQDLDLSVDFAEVLFSGCEVPLFPDAAPYSVSPSWELVLPETYNAACAVSQSNINWIIESILKQDSQWNVNEVLIALLGEDFEGFSADNAEDDETIMRLSVPPVMDVRASQIRILFNDVILQYRAGGEPQWEASIDLDMIVEPRVQEGRIDFYLTQVAENTHFHVMRDNPGNLGIFDHSTLASDVFDGLPEILGDSPDDPPISLDLDAFSSTILFEDVLSPIAVRAGGGYLYVDMAISDLVLTDFIMWDKRCE